LPVCPLKLEISKIGTGSNYTLSQEQQGLAGKYLLGKEVYDGRVSQDLITKFSEQEVMCILIAVMVVMILLYAYLGKRPESES